MTTTRVIIATFIMDNLRAICVAMNESETDLVSLGATIVAIMMDELDPPRKRLVIVCVCVCANAQPIK